MIALLLLACEILGILSAIHAVMHTRTSQGAIAWAVSLVFCPYIAVPAYWILGRSRFQGYTTARQGKLHEKAMLIDRSVSTIGTANFDNRSFRLNFEITAIVADQQFATQVEQMFEADFAKARLMQPDEASHKPWWFRFVVRLARLTGPMQ